MIRSIALLALLVPPPPLTSGIVPARSAGEDEARTSPAAETTAAQQEFVAAGPFHRALVPQDSGELARLQGAGAVLWIEDYGSFSLVLFDERLAGGLERLREAGVNIVDRMTLVQLNGYRIDGADPASTEAELASVPDSLRAPARAQAGTPGLALVQFIGPPRGAWLDALRETGVRVVTYVPNNAYVVQVAGASAAAFESLEEAAYVLSVRTYEPAFKLHPRLRPPTLVADRNYDVVVQVIADHEGRSFAESLPAHAVARLFGPNPVLGYLNLGLRLDGARVLELARDPRVFAIEPNTEVGPLDERQCQVVAGELTAGGTGPSGPDYLAWLASVGIPASHPPSDFVVDVEDSGIHEGVFGRTKRVSVGSDGSEANGACTNPSISEYGQRVAFQSYATHLVPGDDNPERDVFVHSEDGTLQMVSVDSNGAQGNMESWEPRISADGRFVVFTSRASNLVLDDNNGVHDVFVRDLVTGTTERVSVNSAGTEGDSWSWSGSISADGRFVAFVSQSTNMAPGHDNFYEHVYVRDREAGTTQVVSLGLGGAVEDGGCDESVISANGGFVAFRSNSTNLVHGDTNGHWDIFVRDLQAGSTERASISSSGTQADQSLSYHPALSVDGRFVAFDSHATTLVPGDFNGSADVFVRDRVMGTTQRVSVGAGGVEGDWDSGTPTISADGRFVAFSSGASNLAPGFNNYSHVYLRDTLEGSTRRISNSTAGVPGNWDSGGPAITSDGQVIAFESWATNLVENDTNSSPDVFVHRVEDIDRDFRIQGVPSNPGRIAYNFNYSSDPLANDITGHGTLCASIIAGYNSEPGSSFEDLLGYQYGLGIVPWVRVGNSKLIPGSGMTDFTLSSTASRAAAAYGAGARISNKSWGTLTPSPEYTTTCQEHDRAVRDADLAAEGNQEMVIVFAAGNLGELGASSLSSPAAAKNVITVGASESWRPTDTFPCGPADLADDSRDLATFSARGPTLDGRNKPELVAPGTRVQGSGSHASDYDGSGVCAPWLPDDTTYTMHYGTSFAAPAVTGACALLRQGFLDRGLAPPSPALTKALLVAGTTYLTGNGANDDLWSNGQGMGRLDLDESLRASHGLLVDQTHVFGETGEVYKREVHLNASNRPVRVVLAWTDAPGMPGAIISVNDLDLEVKVGGSTYLGNHFTGAISYPGSTPDPRNNLESVFLPPGTSGPCTIVVRASVIAGNGVPGNADDMDQDFALVVSGKMLVGRER